MGAISMLTDITKRKEDEETLNNIGAARKKEIRHRIKNFYRQRQRRNLNQTSQGRNHRT